MGSLLWSLMTALRFLLRTWGSGLSWMSAHFSAMCGCPDWIRRSARSMQRSTGVKDTFALCGWSLVNRLKVLQLLVVPTSSAPSSWGRFSCMLRAQSDASWLWPLVAQTTPSDDSNVNISIIIKFCSFFATNKTDVPPQTGKEVNVLISLETQIN